LSDGIDAHCFLEWELGLADMVVLLSLLMITLSPYILFTLFYNLLDSDLEAD